MITRTMEEEIRQIVREEIAADELRRIEQERRANNIRVEILPGVQPHPLVVFLNRLNGR